MKRLALTVAAAALLSACAVAPVERITVDDSYRLVLSRTRVIQPGQAPAGTQEIQPVTAISCQHLTTDPTATEQDAVQQLQIKADRLGGNAVILGSCSGPPVSDLARDCWTRITCTGTAARIQ